MARRQASLILLVVLLFITGCKSVRPNAVDLPEGMTQQLDVARSWSRLANRHKGDPQAWLNCAVTAYRVMGAQQPELATEAAALATNCTHEFLGLAIGNPARRWTEGETRVGRASLNVEFRQLSPYLHGPITLVRADDVPVSLYGDKRFLSSGFGVPLVAVTPRCTNRPYCGLLPREGVFRSATAWLEPSSATPGAPARLVVADALAIKSVTVDGTSHQLATDTSAFYALGAGMSSLRRLGIWGLIGGDEVGRRAGIYILDEYDPAKRPVVMIHGLGSNPIAWARLSNAIWGDPELRTRYQVWHVVYQTNAPLLISRHRIRGYLDDAWRALDPENDDPARSAMVLVGHSMGGVIARLLCVDSGDSLWSAAFTMPPERIRAAPERIAPIESMFRFQAYSGISRAVFLAAPHGGSPSAESWWGRLSRILVGRGVPELEELREFALSIPEAIQPALLKSYQKANFNLITNEPQPVLRADMAWAA